MNRLLCRGFSFLRTVASIHAATNPNGSKAAVSDAGPPVGRVFRAMRGPEADYASECIISAPECNACGMPAASSAAHERVAAVLQRRPLCVVLLKTDTPAFAILAGKEQGVTLEKVLRHTPPPTHPASYSQAQSRSMQLRRCILLTSPHHLYECTPTLYPRVAYFHIR
jgi:hypothetical protein